MCETGAINGLLIAQVILSLAKYNHVPCSFHIQSLNGYFKTNQNKLQILSQTENNAHYTGKKVDYPGLEKT